MLVPKPHRKNEEKNECCDKENCHEIDKCCEEKCLNETKGFSLFGDNFLKNFKLDDIILIAIIFMFLNDSCEDKSLLLIIGAIFLLGFN